MELHNDAIPPHLMDRRLLFDHSPFTLEPGLLFAEAASIRISISSMRNFVELHLSKTAYVVNTFQQKVNNGRGTKVITTAYHIVFLQLFDARLARGTVPDQNLQTFGVCFNFIPPLHNSDSGSSGA